MILGVPQTDVGAESASAWDLNGARKLKMTNDETHPYPCSECYRVFKTYSEHYDHMVGVHGWGKEDS